MIFVGVLKSGRGKRGFVSCATVRVGSLRLLADTNEIFNSISADMGLS
jgi:hypothetical protein